MTGNVAGELKFGLWQNVFGLMGKNCFRKLSASSGLDPWIVQPMTKEPWASLSLSLRDISVTNAACYNQREKLKKKCHLAEGVSRCGGLSSDVQRPNFSTKLIFFLISFFFEWKLLLGLVIISGFLDNLDVNGRCRPTPSTGVVLRFGRFPVRFGREIERLARFRLWPAGKCLARVNVRVWAQKRATK